MIYLIAVIILLGALIFVHELGHFLLAKFFGVKVEVFSLGFGTKLLKKKIGETEYCISAFPLGGYVRLFGEDPTQTVSSKEKKKAFSEQSVYRRLAIVGAGPGFNLLFAILIYIIFLLFGLEPVMTSHVPRVLKDSQAYQAGLRSGDQIVAIEGKEVQQWTDVDHWVRKNPNTTLKFLVNRLTENIPVEISVMGEEATNLYGDKEYIGTIKGIETTPPGTEIGISNPASLAGLAGFKTGDSIVSINKVPVHYWHTIEEILTETSEAHLVFDVKWGDRTQKLTIQFPPIYSKLSQIEKLQWVGLHPSELFVREVPLSQSSAEAAGLQAGDRLVAVGDELIQSFHHFHDLVQASGKNNKTIQLTYERAGKMLAVDLLPKKGEVSSDVGSTLHYWQIGVKLSPNYAQPQVFYPQSFNPIKVISYAFVSTFKWFYVIAESLVKLVQGKVSSKAIGGPILIGKMAGEQFQLGLFPFLRIMAIISINLALLNFLPIPILDGGHLFFFFLEFIFRRPLPARVMSIANNVGLGFLILLMVFAFFNDFARYWHQISQYFMSLLLKLGQIFS